MHNYLDHKAKICNCINDAVANGTDEKINLMHELKVKIDSVESEIVNLPYNSRIVGFLL